jgi:glycosyltransferase involved in cell wall biosynthesis
MYQSKLIRITTVPLSLQKLLTGQMRFMRNQGFEVTMVSSDFEGKQQLEADEDSVFVPLNMTRKVSPIEDLKSLIAMYRLMKRLKPKIVHTHTPKAGLIGMLASKMADVPIRLHTVAGLPLMEKTGLMRKLLELMETLTYACATKVYPNSTHLKTFICKHNFAKNEKLKVIGNGSSNGINTQTFTLTTELETKATALRTQLNFTASDFVFIFIGRLVKDKGIEELVEAFDTLGEQYPKLKLLLVGPEEPELDALSTNCLNSIKHHPAISHVGYQADVRPYLALSNALAFPSYREGFPNVPMQAGCFNLPSIVTDINGCNEIIIPEENGLIIPVKDAMALKVSMERLYTDTILYQHMAGNARKMIVERYEQQKVWELILKEYQHLLNLKNLV